MENRRCPVCSESGHDSTGNHLYLMADGKTWTCRRTEYHPDGQIYFEKDETSGSEKRKPSFTIGASSSGSGGSSKNKINPLDYGTTRFRGLPSEAYELYGARMQVSEDRGLPELVFYPFYEKGTDRIFWKVRKVEPKEFWWLTNPGKDCQLEFFGQRDVIGRKRLVITEGQDDAVAARYMLSKYKVPCVSTTHGDKVQVFMDNYDFLQEFEEVIFLPDVDKAGTDLRDKVVEVMPKIKIGVTQLKDACEMYKQGREQEFVSAVFSAKVYSPPTVVSVADVIEKALVPPSWGRLWPWPGLNQLTFGRRDGEGMYLGAGVKNGKCFAPGTLVRMGDGSLRPVELISVGNQVLTPSGIGVVGSLHEGEDRMFLVKQKKGMDYVVNSEHLICLERTGTGERIEVAAEILGFLPKKGDWKGYREMAPYKEDPPFDPYILGIWLGDGSNYCPEITCGDAEVIEAWEEFGLSLGLSCTKREKSGCIRAYLSSGKNGKENPAWKLFKELSLPLNKHIPSSFKYAKEHHRMELVAGMIDTDGNKGKAWYEWSTKYPQLKEDFVEVCLSLGYRATWNEKRVGGSTYYVVRISGRPPLRVARKRVLSPCKRDPRLTGVDVIPAGIGKYHGFSLIGEDKRFFLEDYTVVHNSEWINEVAVQNIKVGGPPIALVKYEEPPDRTLKRLAGKLDNCVYHNPSLPFNQKALRERLEFLQDKVLMYRTPPGRPADWEQLKAYIRFVVLEYGVKDIIIDPVTRITNHLNSSDTESLLRSFADELSAMSQQLGFFYIVTCHLKAPEKGPPHERGGEIYSNQFRGSRAMMEACYQMAGIKRNRDPELPEDERNSSQLVLLEEREYGNSGIVDLFYDRNTQHYWEVDNPPPDQLYGETTAISSFSAGSSFVSRETKEVKPTKEGQEDLTKALNQVAKPRVMSKRAQAKGAITNAGGNVAKPDGPGGPAVRGDSINRPSDGTVDNNDGRGSLLNKEESDGVDCSGSESRAVDSSADRTVVDDPGGKASKRRGGRSSLRIG